MRPRDCVAAARARRAAGALVLAVAMLTVAVVPPVRADPSFDVSAALAEDADYVAGKRALERKDWDAAAKRLSQALVRHPDDADLHNELGYAYRHLRQMERAFVHYQRALALDPRHRGAHEYIGEAYLMVDDLAGAEKHLAALRGICLLRCDELEDLEKAIGGYRSAKGLPAAAAAAR